MKMRGREGRTAMRRLTPRLRILESDPLLRMILFGFLFWTALAALGLLTALLR